MQLTLIRHPPVAVAQGLCYGRTEVPLVADWHDNIGHWHDLATVHPRPMVCCSPALRCREPALRVWPRAAVETDLQEMHFGTWENRPWAALDAAETEAWYADIENHPPPGGESLNALSERVVAVFERRYQQAMTESHEHLILISHAAAIRCLMAHLLGISPIHAWRFEVVFAALTRFQLGGKQPVLLSLNARHP